MKKQSNKKHHCRASPLGGSLHLPLTKSSGSSEKENRSWKMKQIIEVSQCHYRTKKKAVGGKAPAPQLERKKA
jgi:hypothetical protein